MTGKALDDYREKLSHVNKMDDNRLPNLICKSTKINGKETQKDKTSFRLTAEKNRNTEKINIHRAVT
jgi:hypothetical protein